VGADVPAGRASAIDWLANVFMPRWAVLQRS
jgi:hypothetical protein